MGEVHEHPDGLVYVRTDMGTYVDTVENFARDSGVTLPPMPEGANDHIYTQGKRHAYMGDGNVIAGGPMPWPEGDALIDNYAQLRAFQLSRMK
jgi:hypothetical protein